MIAHAGVSDGGDSPRSHPPIEGIDISFVSHCLLAIVDENVQTATVEVLPVQV